MTYLGMPENVAALVALGLLFGGAIVQFAVAKALVTRVKAVSPGVWANAGEWEPSVVDWLRQRNLRVRLLSSVESHPDRRLSRLRVAFTVARLASQVGLAIFAYIFIALFWVR